MRFVGRQIRQDTSEITADFLSQACEDRDDEASNFLSEFGGAIGLAWKLGSDPNKGLPIFEVNSNFEDRTKR